VKYRRLGRTGVQVSEIGLGTWKTFDVRGAARDAHCTRITREVIRLGGNFFDTAPMYGDAERVLGLALEGVRAEALIATKVLEYSEAQALASIERSFKLLKTDVIDLFQIHNLASWRLVTPILKRLQDAGRIRFIGITEYDVSKYSEVIEAMRTGEFDTIQIPYNLAERSCQNEILPLAQELNLGVIVMTPIAPIFNRNLLLGRLSRANLSFLEPYGVLTAGQALLGYILSDPAVSTVIPATSKFERVAKNIAVSDGDLFPPDVCRQLEALF